MQKKHNENQQKHKLDQRALEGESSKPKKPSTQQVQHFRAQARNQQVESQSMDILQNFGNISWCKPDWSLPSMSEESIQLMQQCTNLPKVELSDDIEELIRRSLAFSVPFPIETVRLEKLKERRPVEKLRKNAMDTYPLLHERVLLLMTHFLIYKRKFGTDIEKAFYKDMSVLDLVDRILKKRAATFMGSYDKYKLLSGKQGRGGWESVGTLQQKPPLVLANCLSYDEMKLSAMLYVSGPTECINDGTRRNDGVVREEETETDAIIIGVIGPRFKRENRMDCEDILITSKQNTRENGYGKKMTPTSANLSEKQMWRQLWAEFYQVPSYTYDEIAANIDKSKRKSPKDRYTERYVFVSDGSIFDNEVYYKRLCVIAETTLLEADARAEAAGKSAFVNIIGAGLGVWRASDHQEDVYVLTFLERIRSLLEKTLLNHVSDVNFAYIKPSKSLLDLFTNAGGNISSNKKIFFESKEHPRGGINVQLENREPSAKLTGEHEGKLLVMTYPWDGNAHPGNEFWISKLHGSGDSAAACSTQVAELHNAHINPALRGAGVRVAAATGMRALSDYCAAQTA